ncbi:ATP-dependent zinc metalloprotease FtsH [Sinomicrobium weinanense]|nr:ATP-dependent zinc metalloprotease FtsH [Sinomicrobium weinanense]
MSWIYIILFIVLIWLWFFKGQNTIQETTWKQFEEEMLVPKDVARLTVVNNARVEIYIREESLDKPLYKNIPRRLLNDEPVPGPHFYFNIGSVEIFHAELEKAQENLPGTEHVTVTYGTRENWWQNFLFLLPIIFLVLFWMFLLRRGIPGMKGKGTSIFNFGQSNARVIEKGTKSKITFKDVAGMEEAKEEIYELITFLKSPDKYKRLGAKMPKGVLLVGPPGTGKTLLAKAIAGEAGVPFFSLSGSEFVEMFVGVGASRMRDLFQKAKAKAPCIIFIDEIDTVGRARGKAHAFQANDERESTLNQLLAELDGFDTDAGVIVLAATNRGDVLDPALLRPGRFDRHIHLELPNLKEREAIFSVHLKPLQLSGDVNTAALAAQTPGFSGADIANICNEAALIAARREKQVVGKQDFMDAIDRVIGGLEKKSKIITPEEKRRIAYHEAGHVTASWYLEHAHPVLKVSIIPRGRSLGAAWYIPEERQIITRSEFFDAICTALGGRAAEELIFEEVSSNALDDLEKATKQAYNMVVNYGLGTTLRNISFYDSTGRTEQSLYRSYSERTAQKIDSEAQQIIDDAYDKTIQILLDHQDQLHALAKALIRKETLHRPDVEEILGARKKSEDHASP